MIQGHFSKNSYCCCKSIFYNVFNVYFAYIMDINRILFNQVNVYISIYKWVREYIC